MKDYEYDYKPETFKETIVGANLDRVQTPTLNEALQPFCIASGAFWPTSLFIWLLCKSCFGRSPPGQGYMLASTSVVAIKIPALTVIAVIKDIVSKMTELP